MWDLRIFLFIKIKVFLGIQSVCRIEVQLIECETNEKDETQTRGGKKSRVYKDCGANYMVYALEEFQQA